MLCFSTPSRLGGLSATDVAADNAEAAIERSEAASVAPPVVASGHGERQRHGGERGDLPVERTREEELVEDYHGDGLAEDHTDGHNLQREERLELLPPGRTGTVVCGGRVCSDLFPLVLVEDDGREEEDGMAKKPQEASLNRTQ